ncbi:MAG: FAD-dependent oxidoreductase [Actinomycetia bacterium]|nr:FAD-dependent oxidoreductase [Actinomycetes bacterium]
MRWQNWAGNQSADPVAVEHPSYREDLVRIVREAGTRRIKAVGAGHSFTAIAVTDGIQVQLDRYARLVSVDRESGLVTVESGMPLHQLNALLLQHGLGLTNMGDVDAQTISGAISTGTHGTGRSSASLAAQVVGLELVLASGEVVTCSATERPDLFAAACVGLGALGLISTVTIQTEPAFLLEADERPMPLDDVLDGIDELVAANEHFEYYWFPHTATALVKRNNRTDGPPRPLGLRGLLDDEVLSNGLFRLTCEVAKARPDLTARINGIAAKALGARTYVDAAPRVFTSPRRVRFKEMEYAIPRAELAPVVRELQSFVESSGLQISFPVEVRVAPADDLWLSTASGRDSAYVAVHVFRGTDHERYFEGAERIFTAAGGRPHWGKLHTRTADDLRASYPRFDDFVRLRDELDPDRRFANDYLDRVLGA